MTSDPGDAGILVTWRESPLAAKALLAGILVNRLGSFIRVFLVLFLTEERGFSNVQAGIALGASSAGAVVGVLVGGALTDRLGPRRTILASLSSTAVLTLSIFYVTYFPALLVVVAVVGAVGWAYGPAANTLLSRLTPRHRQVMLFAMVRLFYNLGTTVAPLVGVALVALSYGALFWTEAAAIGAYALIAAFALGRAKIPLPERPPTGRERGGYGPVLADFRYVLFLFAALINALVYVQYVSTLPVAITAAGLSTGFYGAVVSLNGFIVITSELLVTKVTQRLPMRIVVMTGFVLLGGGMAIYALPFGAAVFVVGTLVWTLAEIVAGPTIFAYPAVVSPERLRGRYIGALTAIFGIGSATGAVVGLAVWNQFGQAVWVWCGVACLLGLGAVWWGMRRPAPDAEQAPAPDAGQAPALDAGQAPALDAGQAPVPAQPTPEQQTTTRELTDR